MEIERSLEPITINDLKELYEGSVKRLYEYLITGQGEKWLSLYDIERPLAIALFQGAALHYQDTINGVPCYLELGL